MLIERIMKYHGLKCKAVQNPTGLSKSEHDDFLILEKEFLGYDLLAVIYSEYIKSEAGKIIAMSALEFYSNASAFTYLIDRCRVAKRALMDIRSMK